MGLMTTDDAELPALPNGYKYMPCRYCQGMMVVGNKRKKTPAHIECGVDVAQNNLRQIHERKGPYYDRWLQAQARAVERLARGYPPQSD